ncbi:DUF721 domain-containing protein [Anaplasma phagocytophilum str. Norway variant1]|uniref:DUF721 domain-containing protein n=1 Tax=Anaplasma phagocytophilum str. Norway variant1 TaxID=1392506 RepID=A0A7H9DZY4_ANAPH|nr:DUF721 domain-containing protein [Anaplasma phagocytophilum]QLL66729.1 DUF721 domain-containing protein [Anaplasma phagocytophilum str. Norway variant1]
MSRFVTKHGYKSVNSVVESFVLKRCNLWSISKIEVRLFLNWRSIVGSTIADMASPDRVVFTGNNSGALCLQVKNGGYAMFLQYAIPGIIEKISVYFGFKAIHSIKIRQ